MAPSVVMMAQEHVSEPVSRTFQYRKYMKPMLERKRRARINRCLDELKELMTGAFQSGDVDNVTKLEKADILELTVRHLHSLRRQNKLFATSTVTYNDRFRAGFTHCAAEVSQFLNKIDQNANAHLMRHLRDCIQRCDIPAPPALRMSSPEAPHFYSPAAISAVVAAAASKSSQIVPKAVPEGTSNNNNNYLPSGYISSSSPGLQLCKLAAADPDNRPVLIKRSISPSGKEIDDPAHEMMNGGDVWRPW